MRRPQVQETIVCCLLLWRQFYKPNVENLYKDIFSARCVTSTKYEFKRKLRLFSENWLKKHKAKNLALTLLFLLMGLCENI